MSHLLDTHAFLWAAFAPAQLSRRALAVIEDRQNLIVVSVVTFWEIALKHALGKLELEGVAPDDLPEVATRMDLGIQALAADPVPPVHAKDDAPGSRCAPRRPWWRRGRPVRAGLHSTARQAFLRGLQSPAWDSPK